MSGRRIIEGITRVSSWQVQALYAGSVSSPLSRWGELVRKYTTSIASGSWRSGEESRPVLIDAVSLRVLDGNHRCSALYHGAGPAELWVRFTNVAPERRRYLVSLGDANFTTGELIIIKWGLAVPTDFIIYYGGGAKTEAPRRRARYCYPALVPGLAALRRHN